MQRVGMEIKNYLVLIGVFLMAGSVMANIKTGYGYVENIYILPSKSLLDAKLDTGAGISSVSATNIHIHEKDKAKYVSFEVTHEAIENGKRNKEKVEKIAYDLPLKKVMRIKNRAGEDKTEQYDERPVVEMPICFDGKVYNVEVNLTDRTHFDYPVLLGRKALIQVGAVVDPGQKFTLSETSCTLLFKEMEQEQQSTDKMEKNKADTKVDNKEETSAQSKPNAEDK